MAPDPKLIAVVEDEEEARTFLIQILEFEGFHAMGFANGAEALRYLENADAPSLIILDLKMPVMDGPQFRAAQLKSPKLAKVPVIIVTALDPSAAAGMSALRVFRKPLNVEALVNVVRQNC